MLKNQRWEEGLYEMVIIRRSFVRVDEIPPVHPYDMASPTFSGMRRVNGVNFPPLARRGLELYHRLASKTEEIL